MTSFAIEEKTRGECFAVGAIGCTLDTSNRTVKMCCNGFLVGRALLNIDQHRQDCLCMSSLGGFTTSN